MAAQFSAASFNHQGEAMKAERINAVKVEMQRLQKAILDLENAEGAANGNRNGYYYGRAVHTGRVRRASMDLTRALADLRRSNYE